MRPGLKISAHYKDPGFKVWSFNSIKCEYPCYFQISDVPFNSDSITTYVLMLLICIDINNYVLELLKPASSTRCCNHIADVE